MDCGRLITCSTVEAKYFTMSVHIDGGSKILPADGRHCYGGSAVSIAKTNRHRSESVACDIRSEDRMCIRVIIQDAPSSRPFPQKSYAVGRSFPAGRDEAYVEVSDGTTKPRATVSKEKQGLENSSVTDRRSLIPIMHYYYLVVKFGYRTHPKR